MPVPSWSTALRRLSRQLSRNRRRPATARLGLDTHLENRLAPSSGIVGPADDLLPLPYREPGPAFDASGRALVGNRSIIQDQLLWLYNAFQDRGDGWNQPEPSGFDGLDATPGSELQVDPAGRVLVRINGADVVALESELARIGYDKVASFPSAHLTEGWLPIASLPQIESLTERGLIGLIPVWKPRTNVGLTTSQGDFVMESDRVRSAVPAGFNGAGVKVGVLSDSYNRASGAITNASQDVANGDLPGPGNPNGFTTPVQVIQDEPGAGTDEGRAMLQIVHDVAPGAALAFATANGGEGNFANNIIALANAGSRVIVDDIIYLAEPRFQHGIVAQAVAAVAGAGVTYFSSAGNQADDAWETLNPQLWLADFLPNNDPNRTFDQGNEIWVDMNPASGGLDLLQTVTLPPQSQVLMLLQWDDPWYTANGVLSDIDICVFDTNGTFFASLSGETDNIGNQTPLEAIQFVNSGGSAVSFQIGLRLFSGPLVSRIRYQDWGSLIINEYATNSPTISPHAGIPEAVGVAAVPYWNQRGREDFTSSGPMTVLFDPFGNRLPSPIISPNPQIAAPDDANTSFFAAGYDPDGDNRPNFPGTSAAAPHAAAVAALILQAHPGSSPVQVVQRLVSSADGNTDAPGFDKYTGWGMINAYDAIFGGAGDNVGGSFQDSLDSSALGPQWQTYSTGSGRIQATNANGPLSGSHVILHERLGDSGNVTGPNSRNELTLRVNPNAPGSTGVLLFSSKEFNDDDHPMPATFTGSSSSDGVAFSVDGNTWHRILSLTGTNSTNTYQSWAVNLPGLAASLGVTLSNQTLIRFQQFDNANFPEDGIAFDSISFGINQAPAFTAGPAQSVNEDAGPQSISGWATNISPGPAAFGLESNQTVTFEIVSNSNPGLFSVPPAITPTGNLSYTPVADAFGSATIGVRLKDSGGTAGGGIDTTPVQNFTITVNPVNDTPSFTAGGNVSVPEDAGAVSVAEWATNISKGPLNESGQTLSFLVTTNNNAIFSVLPTVTPAGTLKFTPAAQGTATVTVQLQDNGGGANTSPQQSFTITITQGGISSNAPSLSGIESTTLEYTAGQGQVNVTQTLSVADSDSANLQGATVTISSYVSGEDFLRFTNQGGITGTFSTVTGVLTLTGSGSLAAYQTALRSVRYENTSPTPSTFTRTITFLVTDTSALNSNTMSRNVSVQSSGGGGGGGGIVLSPVNKKWVFTDDDGDLVTVMFKSPVGTATLTLTNNEGPIQSIALDDTDPRSALTILVKRPKFSSGNGRVSLGEVTGSGLKSLTGKAVNLNGTGINLNGYLGSLTLADVQGGADIAATGSPVQKTRLTLGVVGSGANITLGSAIGILKATSFGTGVITAPSAGLISILGKFSADITLDGDGVLPGRPVLSALKVGGDIVGSNISVAGNVNLVSAMTFRDSTLFAGYSGATDGSGNFDVAATVNAFQVKGLSGAFDNSHVIASTIRSASLRSVEEDNGGNVFGFVASTSINRLTIGKPVIFRYTPLDGDFKDLDDFRVEIV